MLVLVVENSSMHNVPWINDNLCLARMALVLDGSQVCIIYMYD